MQTFREYYNGDNMMNSNAVSVKQGGKSIMRTGRKHVVMYEDEEGRPAGKIQRKAE